ncbi:hypothetical protein J6Z39_06420 [bacterium]|nr:hypothetical protein [bacterium]
MIGEIVFKLRTVESNGIAPSEWKEWEKFVCQKLRVKRIMQTFSGTPAYKEQQWKEYASETNTRFLSKLRKGSFDVFLNSGIQNDENGDVQVKNYFGECLRKLFINVKIEYENMKRRTGKNGEIVYEEESSIKHDESGDSYEEEYEDENVDTEVSLTTSMLLEKLPAILESILDFIEKKDGRAGQIKSIYKRDSRYLNRKEKTDIEWADEIIANKRLAEEGDLAVNFMIFFIWWWREEITTDGKSYGLQEYIDYVLDKTNGELRKNVKTESDRQRRILDYIAESFKKAGVTSEDRDFASFFLNQLVDDFKERKPEILENFSENEFLERFMVSESSFLDGEEND